MNEAPVIYLGRPIPKDNFRAFIYAPDGSQRLVESWEDFEDSIESGFWFATAQNAKESIHQVEIEEEKPKGRPKGSKKEHKKDEDSETKAMMESAKILESAFSVLDAELRESDELGAPITDDFLPKE